MNDSMKNDALLALRRRYAAALPAKVAKASEEVLDYLAEPGDASRCEIAHRALHSLIGSSGTYGFADLSRTARSAEALLRQSLESGAPLTPVERIVLVDLIAGLGSLAASAARETAAGAA